MWSCFPNGVPMWTRLIKTPYLFARLVLSLTMVIVPVLIMAPCCCVKAVLAASAEHVQSKASCCRQNDRPSLEKEDSARSCCGQSQRSSSDAPQKPCCDFSRSSCDCCQPEAKVTRSSAPRADSKPDLQGTETLLTDFVSFAEISVKLDVKDVLSALTPCPRNRTQSLLCVWRN